MRSSVHDIADSVVLDEFDLPNKAADRAREVLRLTAACTLLYPLGSNGVRSLFYHVLQILTPTNVRNLIVPDPSTTHQFSRHFIRSFYPARPTSSRYILVSLGLLALKMMLRPSVFLAL